MKTISSEITSRPDILKFLEGNESISKLFDTPTGISRQRVELYKRLYDGVGNNNCYHVNLPNCNVLHVKMEYANPMGNNHYSRYWLPYLFIAETLGVIHPGDTQIVEVTSGSSGISLSLACEKLNYDLTMIIPDMLPSGRTQPMLDSGTELIKVDGYIDACISKLKRIVVQRDCFATNHSEEESNLITYIFSRIGYEYIAQYGNPDISILGLGNGTSTEAIAHVIRKNRHDAKILAYHPSLEGENVILGLLAKNVDLKHIEPAKRLVDKILYPSENSIEEMQEVFRHDTEISNLGHSSLYAIKFAYEISKSVEGKTFFTIGYDKIDRYNE